MYSIQICTEFWTVFNLSLCPIYTSIFFKVKGQIAKWNESFREMSGSIGCLDWLCLHIITYHTCLILFQYDYKDSSSSSLLSQKYKYMTVIFTASLLSQLWAFELWHRIEWWFIRMMLKGIQAILVRIGCNESMM